VCGRAIPRRDPAWRYAACGRGVVAGPVFCSVLVDVAIVRVCAQRWSIAGAGWRRTLPPHQPPTKPPPASASLVCWEAPRTMV